MHNKRQERIRTLLVDNGIDALFISNFYNISYFTGFTTLVPHEREAFALITKNNMYVMSDGRYDYQVKSQMSNVKSESQKSNVYEFKLLTPQKGLVKHLQEIIEEEKITTLAFEQEDLKWGEYDHFQKKLNIMLIPVDRAGVKIRAIKEKEEIEKIKKACEIGDRCLSDIVKTIKVGDSEKEIGWRIEQWIREKGFEVGFDPIVATDANAAIPHYDTKNGNEVVKNNSLILIDMGVRYQRYNSDITRMFTIGVPPPEIANAYQILLNAQTKTIEQISKSQKFSDIDIFCRQEVTRYMLHVPSYSHSTGHGVGLEVHEYPKVSTVSNDILQEGQVFTIEPGIYIPGKWGMRIEDIIAVSPALHHQVLTQFPKELRVL